MHLSRRLVAAVAASLAGLVVGASVTTLPSAHAASPPPPAGGYSRLIPAGAFARLPSDTAAAATVRRSPWEPRPQNAAANSSAPARPLSAVPGYGGMENGPKLFGRVTGAFRGTTDETIQWAAVKWGLPDDVVRAQAVTESNWYQNEKIAGVPVRDHGYGDYGQCGGSPAGAGYGSSGPASFGIMQIKHCSHPHTWKYSESSTAYNLDYYGAIMRGCIEGWDSWLGKGYAAGDLWGCVGRWFSGDWYGAGAVAYIAKVKTHLSSKPWRTWASAGGTRPAPRLQAPSPRPTRAAAPGPATKARRGLSATYFDGPALQGKTVRRIDPRVDFSWRSGSPDRSIPRERFSARWQGVLTAPTTGYYRFSTVSDDGVRLLLDDKRLIENWTRHPVRTDISPRVHLRAGQRYPLRLEYYERTGGATMRLLWAGPGWRATVVPSGVLTP